MLIRVADRTISQYTGANRSFVRRMIERDLVQVKSCGEDERPRCPFAAIIAGYQKHVVLMPYLRDVGFKQFGPVFDRMARHSFNKIGTRNAVWVARSIMRQRDSQRARSAIVKDQSAAAVSRHI